jgi:hypothetical protein
MVAGYFHYSLFTQETATELSESGCSRGKQTFQK